ncbi:MAG: DnaJ domain-containing protein [Porticoccaceae bacterium]
MPKLLLLIAAIVGLWYWWSYQKNLAENKRKPFLWRSGFWLILALSVYLIITGRMHWLGAGIAALIPVLRTLLVWGTRAGPLLRLFGRFKTSPSQFRTEFLVISINFTTGSVEGEIISGDYNGKKLSELSQDELKQLSQQYKTVDKESYVLLQAYLFRSGSNNDQAYQQYNPANFNELTETEAYEILGLPNTASKDEIVKAHKRLMQRMHPDRGGSDYLAAKINAAKDQLVK